jgi:transposase InsO family protein
MNTSELSRELGLSSRAIQKAAKKATASGRYEVKLHGREFSFHETQGIGGRGVIYDFTRTKMVAEKITIKSAKTPNPHDEHQKLLSRGAYTRLSKDKQLEVLERVKLVRSYVEREWSVTFEEWSEGRENLPTKQHLLRLAKLYKQGVKTQNVLDLFCDNRGRPKGSFKLTTEMQEMAQRYILRRDIHPNDTSIYKLMKHAFGDALPSCDTVCRYLTHYREANRMLVDFARDPDRAKGKYRAAFGNASAQAKYKNHFWELDGTPADLLTADGKRPTIVAAIDIYSRRVVLSVEEKSTSYALARNLREGILKLGVPENVITDNGKDYKSNHFESVCQNLHINKKEVPPYSGWCKPHIERFFGTMTRELFQQLEGFIGHNVAERSVIQSSLSFERKLEARERWRAQKYTEKGFVRAMMKETMELFVPLTMGELREWLNAWVEAVYEQREHSKIGMSPMEKYNSDITPAKTIDDPRTLDVLLGEWTEMSVSKKGIVIRKDGIEAEYQHMKLIEYIGERVYVALGSDLGEAYVYDAEMAPICTAVDESLSGRSRENMKLLHRQMRKLERESLRAAQKADELAQKLHDPTIKDVIVGAGADIKLPKQTKVLAKVDIALPNERANEVVMNGDKPFFRTDYDALVWAIENGKEEEFGALIEARAELYELAKCEVEHKQTEKVG